MIATARGAMRVLVLSSLFPRSDNRISGSFVHEQVAALRRQGIDARVLTGTERWLGPSRPLASLASIAAYLRQVPAWRSEGAVPCAEFLSLVIGRLGGAARSLSYEHGLRRVMDEVRREFPFDLVHAHTALLDGAAAAALKPSLGVPLVLTEHTGPFGVIVRTPAMRRRVRRALDAADVLIAVSAAHAASIRSSFPDLARSIEVVPNGVDGDLFRPAPPDAAARKQRRIVWIGHLDRVKRPDLAVAAFAALARRRDDAVLHLIGAGPLEPELRQQAERAGLGARIRIEGYLGREAIADRLRQADALLVTSVVETFGIVVVEALATGIPVVATRCGGPEEIIATVPASGRLTSDDPTEIAAALAGVLDAPPDRGLLRHHALARFGIDGVVSRLAAVYAQLLRSPRPLVLVEAGSSCAA
jgi:glycosyltransferase involved in cell wall biosynthesis